MYDRERKEWERKGAKGKGRKGDKGGEEVREDLRRTGKRERDNKRENVN